MLDSQKAAQSNRIDFEKKADKFSLTSFPFPKLSQQALILLTIPLLFQVVFVAVLGYQMNQAEEEAWAEMRAKNIVTEASELIRLCQNSGLGLYKSAIGSEQSFTDQYAQSADQMRKEVYLLRVLVGNNQEQRQVVDQTEGAIQRAWQLALTFEQMNARGEDVNHGVILSQLRTRLIQVTKRLFYVVQKLNDIASKSAEDPLKAAQSRLRVQYVLLGGLALDVLLAIALALLFNRLTNERLATLLDNTTRLAGGDTLIPQLTGNDEIAVLDRRFHEMAAALTEAQRKERAVVQNAVDVICSLDTELRFSRLNPAAQEMFGQATGGLIGSNIVEHIYTDDIRTSTAAVREARTTGSVKAFESRIVRADGSMADALWSVHWAESEQTYFCVLHDITNRKEVERLKQEFVQMISHDLRTPLMSVQTDISLLEAGIVDPVSEKVSKRLGEADKNVSYVIELINSLLDIEKLNAGEVQLEFTQFPLEELLVRAVDAVKPLADRTQVHIEVDCEDLRIVADERRLLQVAINLLSNAVKFSPKDGIVTIAAKSDGMMCTISVTDQGRGIPEMFISKIFDRFRQVEQTDDTMKGGTGLGLSICKAIVEQHGGTISVQSEFNVGSCFAFTIPLSGSSVK